MFSSTSTRHEAETLLPSVAVAVMVALPRPTPRMLPCSSTVTMPVSDDDHESFLVVALEGCMVGVSLRVSPSCIATSCSGNTISLTYVRTPQYSSFQLSRHVQSPPIMMSFFMPMVSCPSLPTSTSTEFW